MSIISDTHENYGFLKLEDDDGVIFSIRALMMKEVGCIIGKRGDILRKIREESGAKVYITDGSCVERIVTVSGTIGALDRAFHLIMRQVEEFCRRNKFHPPGTNPEAKLIVPDMQCGLIIGKGGSKVKNIKNKTGASIQVSFDYLPNSTERLVTVGGEAECVASAINEIAAILVKGVGRMSNVIYYKPHTPVGMDSGKHGEVKEMSSFSTTARANNPSLYGAPPRNYGSVGGMSNVTNPSNEAPRNYGSVGGISNVTNPPNEFVDYGGTQRMPMDYRNVLNTSLSLNNPEPNPLQLIANSNLLKDDMSGNKPALAKANHTAKMAVPSEFIGLIIGKKGSKISEIRQISGAMIRILDAADPENDCAPDEKTVFLTGTLEAIAIAKSLINMSIEVRKAHLKEQEYDEEVAYANQGRSMNPMMPKGQSAPTSNFFQQLQEQQDPLTNVANTLPLLQLLAQPDIFNSLTSLTTLRKSASSPLRSCNVNTGGNASGMDMPGNNFGNQSMRDILSKNRLSKIRDPSVGKTKPFRNPYSPY